MKRIKAAAVQLAPDMTSSTGTIDRVCGAIERAAAQGVELAVFPETFIPYYPYFSFVAPAVLMGKDHLRLYEWAGGSAGLCHRAPVEICCTDRDGACRRC